MKLNNDLKEEIAEWEDYCAGRTSDQEFAGLVKINDLLIEKILRSLLEIYERLEALEKSKLNIEPAQERLSPAEIDEWLEDLGNKNEIKS